MKLGRVNGESLMVLTNHNPLPLILPVTIGNIIFQEANKVTVLFQAKKKPPEWRLCKLLIDHLDRL